MPALKAIFLALVLCLVALTWTKDLRAASESAVVKIDGDAFAAADIRNWWKYWQDEGMVVPENPDPFINWWLFVHEAQRMALYEDAQYRHDIRVYLEVISLVNLKNEEIDSRIDYSEEKLWEYYQENFSPQWLLNILIFKDQESAEKSSADLQAGRVTLADLARIAGERARKEQAQNPHGGRTIDVAELKKLSGAEEKLLGVHEKVVRRPYSMEKSWQEAAEGMSKGSFSLPFPWQESYVILQLEDRVPGDREDFTKREGELRNRYRKYREAVLTNELLKRLEKKFAVQIDEERINRLDPNAPASELTDDPVLTLGKVTVSERQLAEKVRQDIEMNKQYGFKPEDSGAEVRRVAGGIISQTLTTMESLDRHYEQKSPTRELYAFYTRNKLVKKLEGQIRDQGEEVDEQEIISFYEEHLAEFTTPQVYRMAVIQGAEEELKKIWLEAVVNKKDVMVVTEERLGRRPEVTSYPANHLSPEVKERAAALAKGDLSQVFPSGEGFAMLYLAEAIPARTTQLAEVKGMITKKLRQDRFAAAKEEYLKALRGRANIEVDTKAWTKLREDLVKEGEKK